MEKFNKDTIKESSKSYKGRVYQSRGEAAYAKYLDDLLDNKEILSWKAQKQIELFGENGHHVADYLIDFLVEHKDGVMEFVEVKGFAVESWGIKWNLLKDKYGKDCKYKVTLVKV